MNSVEVKSTDMTRSGPAGPSIKNLDTKMNFSIEGAKYRSESRVTENPSGRLVWDQVAVFDGERYFYYSGKSLTLEKTSRLPNRNPYLCFQPFLVPFMFLCGEEVPAELNTMARESTWERLFSTAKVIGREQIEGFSCDVVQIERTAFGKSMRFRIALATDAGYYPVQYTAQDSDGRSAKIIARDLIVRGDRSREVRIPSKVETTDFEPNGEVRISSVYEIDANSLKVNKSIPADRFVAPKGQTTIDVDTGGITHAALPGPVKHWYDLGWWQYGLVAMIVACLIWLWRRRRTRRLALSG